MSRHEGVSCDSCLKTNFPCPRYKCLVCYDYDLCSNCYEQGVTSSTHLTEHPMQCILTRNDIELYYGGEALGGDHAQSFTCPLCKKNGFSDSTLFEHATAEHTENSREVICPVCAAVPGGESNVVTDDFAGHLTIEHRPGNRDLISFLDEPSAIRHGGGRRISHSGRPISGTRPRRTNSGLSVIYPVGRDPTAEILFQLSGGRLGTLSSTSQLQQLQQQIQLERQQVSAARQQLERLPRIPTVYKSLISGNASNAAGIIASSAVAPQPSQIATNASNNGANQANEGQFLLNRLIANAENENVKIETAKADGSQYVLHMFLAVSSGEEDDDADDGDKQIKGSNNKEEETGEKEETTGTTTTVVPDKIDTATNTNEMDCKIEDGMPPPPASGCGGGVGQRRSASAMKKPSTFNVKPGTECHKRTTNPSSQMPQNVPPPPQPSMGNKSRELKTSSSSSVGVIKKSNNSEEAR